MKILTFLALAVFAALLCSCIVKLGNAGSISVGIYDTEGLSKESFSTGENIRIIAESSHTSITIIVTDPDGIAVLNETYERAILGSSIGEADQIFSFGKHPIFSESIWINETSIPEGMEEDEIEVTESGDIWVRWQRVEVFFESDGNSRHYIIDRDSGQVQFGDGVNGMIPPTGGEIKTTYRTGAGEEGAVVAGEVRNLLTSIAYDKTLSGLTTKLGWYTVEASSPVDEVRKNYACVYFHTIPEIPVGTITAVTAMLLGLSLYGLVQRKKLRYSKLN